VFFIFFYFSILFVYYLLYISLTAAIICYGEEIVKRSSLNNDGEK